MSALTDLIAEMARAAGIHGPGTDLPDGTSAEQWAHSRDGLQRTNEVLVDVGTPDWAMVLLEEVHEALAETDPAALRVELVQVAAVAMRWVQAIDARGTT